MTLTWSSTDAQTVSIDQMDVGEVTPAAGGSIRRFLVTERRLSRQLPKALAAAQRLLQQ